MVRPQRSSSSQRIKDQQRVDRCRALGLSRRTHGETTTTSAEYRAWRAMVQRCTDQKHDAYKYYGGRGISVCRRWQRYENFLADMGRKPTAAHTLDRRRNDRNYSPSNCRWATRIEQGRNKSNNVILRHAGKRLSVTAWAALLNINYNTLIHRISALGWSAARALTTPPRKLARVRNQTDPQ